jgi:parallel beta-helix repeat protein
MRSRGLLLAVVLAALLGFSSSIGPFSEGALVQAQPDCTVTVQPGESIQAAIDGAQEGAVLCLAEGTWEENVRIEKSLTLRGADQEQTVIDAIEETDPVIWIKSEEPIAVKLERLTVSGSKHYFGLLIQIQAKVTLQSMKVLDNGGGLSVWNSATVSLIGSTVSNNRGTGLFARDRTIVSLADSTVSSNDAGLVVWDSAQVSLTNSQISDNRLGGLSVSDSAAVTLHVSQVSDNEGNGLSVLDRARVSLTNSQVLRNGFGGLVVGDVAKVDVQASFFLDNRGCGIWVKSGAAHLQGTPNEMGGNGADLCGFAPVSLRKPLVPQTDKIQLVVPGDFASLQEAVDAIAPGGTILMQAGSYETGLTLWKPLNLLGVDQSQIVLKALPDRNLIISIIAEAQGVVIEQLMVTGSQDDGLLIYGEVILQDVQIFDNVGDGLEARGESRVNLTDSTVSNNGEGGLTVEDFALVSLANSQVSNNEGRGLLVDGSATVSLTGSTVSDNGSVGLSVRSVALVSLSESTISGNKDDGLNVEDSALVNLSGSTVSGNGDDGLVIWDSAMMAVRSSIIEGNGTNPNCQEPGPDSNKICNGIEVSNASQTMIIDSIIRGNTDWGVAAHLKQCGYSQDEFYGQVAFILVREIEGNNTAGNHQGQVCLP